MYRIPLANLVLRVARSISQGRMEHLQWHFSTKPGGWHTLRHAVEFSGGRFFVDFEEAEGLTYFLLAA
jgi:hypothetical protein